MNDNRATGDGLHDLRGFDGTALRRALEERQQRIETLFSALAAVADRPAVGQLSTLVHAYGADDIRVRDQRESALAACASAHERLALTTELARIDTALRSEVRGLMALALPADFSERLHRRQWTNDHDSPLLTIHHQARLSGERRLVCELELFGAMFEGAVSECGLRARRCLALLAPCLADWPKGAARRFQVAGRRGDERLTTNIAAPDAASAQAAALAVLAVRYPHETDDRAALEEITLERMIETVEHPIDIEVRRRLTDNGAAG